jgi:hypothetical protein
MSVDSVANWRMAESYDSSATHEIVFSGMNESIDASYYDNPLCGMGAFFGTKSPNFYNNIPTMCPIYTFVNRSDDNASLLGWPESMGQEIVYGSETWKVFRTGKINGVDPTYNNYYGFAFKKVT